MLWQQQKMYMKFVIIYDENVLWKCLLLFRSKAFVIPLAFDVAENSNIRNRSSVLYDYKSVLWEEHKFQVFESKVFGINEVHSLEYCITRTFADC
jgi:hypothetical protein